MEMLAILIGLALVVLAVFVFIEGWREELAAIRKVVKK
ncbi:MAG: hypothetical protein KatS3mg071_1583 [Meiothermus sp.]|nr:MAG: hypothetical protein KatS3mg071_1583 [Meiothermus sp.]